jgi:hypothetical protein
MSTYVTIAGGFGSIKVPRLNDSENTVVRSLLPDATSSEKGAVIVDTAMSDSSTNTVQNKVIKEYVDDAIDGKYAIAG